MSVEISSQISTTIPPSSLCPILLVNLFTWFVFIPFIVYNYTNIVLEEQRYVLLNSFDYCDLINMQVICIQCLETFRYL